MAKKQVDILEEQREINQRQEEILNEQHRALNNMDKQSGFMSKLTLVILVAVGFQIVLAAIQVGIALKWIK